MRLLILHKKGVNPEMKYSDLNRYIMVQKGYLGISGNTRIWFIVLLYYIKI